ncbi:d2.3 [Ichnoviriform fugitivi]|uniref:D2.3 n=1 Tax=Ichnoviriform fugitivi TaxID=265522 RepID=A2Q0J6_9VIRU|nr:d2.3 [Ichnoviriform fugitivi]BAF45711.1 d2.3 [Ichnoviriform fugitivi]
MRNKFYFLYLRTNTFTRYHIRVGCISFTGYFFRVPMPARAMLLHIATSAPQLAVVLLADVSGHRAPRLAGASLPLLRALALCDVFPRRLAEQLLQSSDYCFPTL